MWNVSHFLLCYKRRATRYTPRCSSHSTSASAVAGFVYVLATVGLAGSGPGFRRLSWFAVSFELLGVLLVGAFTAFVPGDFPHDTVWSWFGRGYGFIPLVLPFVGIWWLRRTGRSG